MGNYDTIEISKDDFLPLLNWCLTKFKSDPLSRISIGGRSDKIGGFIDRFSNQCVNWIIFNHLLRNEKFKTDPDYFFYNAKTAKKCADVIGLKGEDGRIVPFTYFDKKQWVHNKKAPFIEVKTVRQEQYCAGLGMPQYDDNHYFVYVESDFDELYLFNFFKDFSEEHMDMSMDEIYVKDNSENIIIFPTKEMPKKIATLRLLGTYKGPEVKKHNLEFPPGKNFRYIKSIDKVNEEDTIDDSKRMHTAISSDRFIYDPLDEGLNNFLPFYTKAGSINMIHKKTKTKGHLFIEVKDPCYLNQFKLNKGFYKIRLDSWPRKGGETEIFNHKSIYDCANHHYPIYPKDCTDELIEEMKSLFH